MPKQIGAFTVEDAFHLTNRGWVLVGELKGHVAIGSWLVLPVEVELLVAGVEVLNQYGAHKTALIISEHFVSRNELVDQHIIGNTARIM